MTRIKLSASQLALYKFTGNRTLFFGGDTPPLLHDLTTIACLGIEAVLPRTFIAVNGLRLNGREKGYLAENVTR